MSMFKTTVCILVDARDTNEAVRIIQARLQEIEFGFKRTGLESRLYPAKVNPALIAALENAKELEAECACCQGTCEVCEHKNSTCCTHPKVDNMFDEIFND